MAGPLMHTVTIKGKPDEIYKAISTGKGLGSFWTRDSQAEPKVGSIAIKVAELKPGKLVRWSDAGGFPGWEGTTVTWEIAPAKEGGHEVRFSHAGWPNAVPPSELASVNYTWGRVVGRLKKHIETGEAVPYFP